MAWEKPKTDWVSSDAPDAAAFNRIEKNISELQNSKRNESSIVPVSNGGTGASTVAAARRNLGLGETSGALPVKNGGASAGDASAARKKPLRFFAEAFRRFVVYVFLGVPQSQTRILLTYVKAATPFLRRAIRGEKRFLPARTRRAYNDYPAPVR